VLPGHADNTITLHLGWGRKVAGRYGNGAGFDVYPLRTTQSFGFGTGFTVEKTGARYKLSQTQETHGMEGRPIAIDTTLEEYRKKPDFAEFKSPTLSTLPLWTEVKYEGHRWSMVIDLNACSGCNACLVACQSENNVSSVGKEQVARGRDMYWLRLDRYFVGEDHNNPEVAFQPVGCQHCEEAPCENVCPVNATAHSPEGLNDMAYNRCIGTRYCMNNCPYKVRRFNFLDYTGQVPETVRMAFNPNVSVRMRGVMEKCSYCVQRIQEAKISARRDNRRLRDGDIKVACQQACSTGAISFGDLNDPMSKVSKLSKLDRQYKLLPEIGTQPRTSFLAKIRNPNPEMQG
jgi:Fe-S-cluster-containing dehydrogenase component